MTKNTKVNAAILIIGNEILSGRTQDTNTSTLATWLNSIGVKVGEVRVIPDIEKTIIDTLNLLKTTYDYVFTTGGIGPTHDDITAESVSKAFGLKYEIHKEAYKILEAYYKPGEFNEGRQKMVWMPENANLILNPTSGAPGFNVENVFCLPGVPSILKSMLGGLTNRIVGGKPILSLTISLRTVESEIAHDLSKVQEDNQDIEIGSYPFFKQGKIGVSLVIRSNKSKLIKKCFADIMKFVKKKKIVAHLKLSGVIGNAGKFKQGIDFSGQEEIIKKAFSLKKAKCVAITINSPGGSPVQSHLIYSFIRQQAKKNNKQVIVFAEDVAASGGYLIACAGDEIYANSSSIIGSIGVIYSSFGFTELIKKIGVERRVHTAGKNKSTLDPFLEEKNEDIERLKNIQLDLHKDFIDVVEKSRGSKLKKSDIELFSGEFWSGSKSKTLGLIDGIGNAHEILKEKYGDDVIIKKFEKTKGWLSQKLSSSNQVDQFANILEERSIWQRYGF